MVGNDLQADLSSPGINGTSESRRIRASVTAVPLSETAKIGTRSASARWRMRALITTKYWIVGIHGG